MREENEEYEDAHFPSLADNVIFIDEFMAELHQRLHEKKQCLKCDKTFGNYDQLRLHMRKKRHLDISGKTEFDRFYLSNYVARSKEEKEEDGGRKEGNDDEEDDEDEATSGKAEDGGGKKGKEEENWEGWMEDSRSGSVCLFCALRLPSSSLCIDHMRLKHDFDLVRLAQEKGLDFFARVRLINYIRRNRESDKGRDWSKLDFDFSDVQLLFPVLEDDELLQHEFEHIEDSREAERLAGKLCFVCSFSQCD